MATNGMDESSIAYIMGMVSMLGTLLFMMAIGAVVAWLIARAVAVIPSELQLVKPGMIWGIYGLWLLFAGGVIAFTLVTYDPDAADESTSLYSFAQIPGQLFYMAATCWVMIRVPASLKAAFAAHPEPTSPQGDHGRLTGIWIAVLGVASGVVGVVGGLVVGQKNPLNEVQRSMAMQHGVDSPFDLPASQMVMGCAMSILGLAMIVLLVIFLVQVSKARGSLLRLQDEARNPVPSAPPAA